MVRLRCGVRLQWERKGLDLVKVVVGGGGGSVDCGNGSTWVWVSGVSTVRISLRYYSA